VQLLLVEDDVRLARTLERGLRHEGHAVDLADSGAEALSLAAAGDYDVVVLDVMLPGGDGLSVCRTLRKEGRWTPVLMLTARADVSDRIAGLEAGADDYLVKPFDFGELVARLGALFRRRSQQRPRARDIGSLHLDPATRVVSRAGREVELTARELAVLECLARHPGEVVSRDELLESVWTESFGVSPNIVDVYVGYLRKKLERAFGRRLIRTVRGAGFVLESR
jgi:two-component system OmpR family response regulator